MFSAYSSIFMGIFKMLVKIIDVPTTCPPGICWENFGTCVDNIWHVLGGHISDTWQGLMPTVNEMLLMGTFGTHNQITFQM
jgi:hypothetical protein